MYQVVYSSPTLRQKDIRQLFTNILVKTGNLVLNIVNFGLKRKPNIINFIKVKNLLPIILYNEPSTIRQCCLKTNTKDLFNNLYSQFVPFASTEVPQDVNYCGSSSCTTPQNLYAAYITNTSAVIGWDLVFGETYDIYVNDTLLESNVTAPYSVNGLTIGTTYIITVKSGDKDTCKADITFSTTNTTCAMPTLTLTYTDPQPIGDTGNLTLHWTVPSTANTLSFTAKRKITLDTAWVTSGFTPANPLPASAITTIGDVQVNEVFWFQVDNNCAIGGPTSSNVVQGIVFACPSVSVATTSTTATTTAGFGVALSAAIPQVRFTLKKTSDNSVVYGPIIVSNVGGTATASTTGLTTATAYYWVYELYAVINGITVISSQAPYNMACTHSITTS